MPDAFTADGGGGSMSDVEDATLSRADRGSGSDSDCDGASDAGSDAGSDIFRPDLDGSERQLMMLLLKLNGKARTELLHTIHNPDLRPSGVRWRNAKQFNQFLDSHSTQVRLVPHPAARPSL